MPVLLRKKSYVNMVRFHTDTMVEMKIINGQSSKSPRVPIPEYIKKTRCIIYEIQRYL